MSHDWALRCLDCRVDSDEVRFQCCKRLWAEREAIAAFHVAVGRGDLDSGGLLLKLCGCDNPPSLEFFVAHKDHRVVAVADYGETVEIADASPRPWIWPRPEPKLIAAGDLVLGHRVYVDSKVELTPDDYGGGAGIFPACGWAIVVAMRRLVDGVRVEFHLGTSHVALMLPINQQLELWNPNMGIGS